MPSALIEMTTFVGATWGDDEYNTWDNDEYNTWEDTDITIRASHVGYAGAQYWDQYVIALTSPQYRIDHPSGGHCKLGFGDITLALEAFVGSGVWPPPESCPCVISYVDSSDVIHQLFVGTMHRQKLNRDGIVYQLYERTFDAMLLDSAVDYNGNTVNLPRAFGAIVNQQPVRLPDASGHHVYHHGYLTGTIGVNWHVFDDGVNVDSNVTNAGASTFEYTVTPVGEITVSGTGTSSTLINIFAWACGAAHLNLSYDSTLATAFTAAFWAASQETLVSFLDRLAAYASHLFYIINESLYLIDMASDNGTLVLTEFDFFPASITFAAPVATLKTNWTDRTAVEDSTGKHIMETPQEVSVVGTHPYGNSGTIDCFQADKTSVGAALTRVLSSMTATRWETSIPLLATFPLPGLKITAIDASMGQNVNIVIHATDIEYDFENLEVKIAGPGTVS